MQIILILLILLQFMIQIFIVFLVQDVESFRAEYYVFPIVQILNKIHFQIVKD